MPLYKCEVCGCIENTALADYWLKQARNLPLTCSACDPNGHGWHGEFSRQTPDEMELVEDADGFFGKPGEDT